MMPSPSSPIQTAPRLPFYRQLYVQVLVAIALGVLIGHFWPDAGVQLKPLGEAFIKLVKMIIAPVIFLTIVTGIAGMKELGAIGRVAAKAFGYFLTFSTLALIVGLIVANVVQPGAGLNIDPATLDAGKVADYAHQAHERTLTGFLMSIIPATMVSAVADGNILQVLFVAILFGIALTMIGDKAAPLMTVLESASHAVFKLVGFLMGDSRVPEEGVPVVLDGQPVGRVTSSRLSPTLARGYGLAWVPVQLAEEDQEIHIRMDGKTVPARVVMEPFYDPAGKRLRE